MFVDVIWVQVPNLTSEHRTRESLVLKTLKNFQKNKKATLTKNKI